MSLRDGEKQWPPGHKKTRFPCRYMEKFVINDAVE
jgi:hypothetical protein